MSVRAAGLLVHPTSLPGPFGIGDFGPASDAFLDWARDAGQSIWQILPLGPTSSHNSPYSCLSAFAGNPLLISPQRLHEQGLLSASDLEAPEFPVERVDRERMGPWKEAVLRRSWDRLRAGGHASLLEEIDAFAQSPLRACWLEDWTLFSALTARFAGRPWTSWPPGLRRREPGALSAARTALAPEIDYHRYLQFLFWRQWTALKARAHHRGIRILGDIPIYVALDSADVWANPHLFDLDDSGRPRTLAGVPPDAFSSTGQLWGNPLYRWDVLDAENYAWWTDRIRDNLALVDILRLDHFRGFASYWKVPAGAASAVSGEWCAGPGAALFQALHAALGQVPLIAEDLGVITDDVRALLAELGLPGMKVLQFAFGMPDSEHLPERFGTNAVVYTGTHDNDTVRGWFAGLPDWERERALAYLGTDGSEIHWDMIAAAYRSPAALAVVPIQDVFGLGSEGRMNDPRKPEGNWEWRASPDAFRPELAGRLKDLADSTSRTPSAQGLRAAEPAGDLTAL